MPFPFKTVLVTGATSGIGRALADRMVGEGIFVVAVGRRKSRLDELVAKHGADKIAVEEFDVGSLEAMGGWVRRVLQSHPILDAIILNAGVQLPVDFTNPSSIDLAALIAEATVNYTSPLHMVVHFLPHLMRRSAPLQPTGVVLVSSGLGFVPVPRVANYAASKAGLHSLAWSLRSQLGRGGEGKGANVRVVEVVPPAVKTELHGTGDGKVVGVELDVFVEELWGRLVGDEVEDEIFVGPVRGLLGGVEDGKRTVFGMFENA